VFFEAQPRAPDELPDRIVGDRDAASCRFNLQAMQRQMRVLIEPLDSEDAMQFQNTLAMAPMLAGASEPVSQ